MIPSVNTKLKPSGKLLVNITNVNKIISNYKCGANMNTRRVSR